MLSLESPHRGKHTIYHFQYKKITLNYSTSAAMGFSKELKNEFETVVVNEPSVFESLKFYCICKVIQNLQLYTSIFLIMRRK